MSLFEYFWSSRPKAKSKESECKDTQPHKDPHPPKSNDAQKTDRDIPPHSASSHSRSHSHSHSHSHSQFRSQSTSSRHTQRDHHHHDRYHAQDSRAYRDHHHRSRASRLLNKKKKKVKKDTGITIALSADKFPASLDTQQQSGQESIISWNGIDRRQKTQHLMTCLDADCDPIDLTKYVVQLTMEKNGSYYVGTGTIIRIIRNTLYILTCAHNVVSFHLVNGTVSNAKNIWFDFDGRKVAATKFYVHPDYKKGNELGNDLAVIECRVSFSFMFYHTYPKLAARSRSIMSTFKTRNEPPKLKEVWKASIYGYPGEKRGEFWGMAGSVRLSKDNSRLFVYDDMDTTGGQSGSPIIDIETNEIIGIHTNGDYLGAKENYGTKLNQTRINWIYDLMPCQVGQHPKDYKNEISTLNKKLYDQ